MTQQKICHPKQRSLQTEEMNKRMPQEVTCVAINISWFFSHFKHPSLEKQCRFNLIDKHVYSNQIRINVYL